MSTKPHTTEWIKASASNDSGTCVQMRRQGETLQVRDSKLGDDSPVLSYNRAELAAWIDGARKGEFDHLLED